MNQFHMYPFKVQLGKYSEHENWHLTKVFKVYKEYANTETTNLPKNWNTGPEKNILERSIVMLSKKISIWKAKIVKKYI